jgi:diacylglycerol kinase
MKRTIQLSKDVGFRSVSNSHTHTQEVISADSLKTLTSVYFTERSLRAHLLVLLILVVTCLILRSFRCVDDEAIATVIHSL